MERGERETFHAVAVTASGQGKWVWWQFVMKQADMQESWSPTLEYIMCLCMDHCSAQMWYLCCECVRTCVCVFMLVVSSMGLTLRSSQALNEVQQLSVHPSVGTPHKSSHFDPGVAKNRTKEMYQRVLQTLKYEVCRVEASESTK